MTGEASRIPTSSQTVGPYFRIGLDYLIDRAATLDANAPRRIEVRGRVLDGDGAPVPDAMLEFWAADASTTFSAPRLNHCQQSMPEVPAGFCRAATDRDGNFAVVTTRPASLTFTDGQMQAPHMLVLVFARGLLRHLLSRVYFEDEAGNSADPVLLQVPAERRGTLIAQFQPLQPNSYRWNVVLQGQGETVFFAW